MRALILFLTFASLLMSETYPKDMFVANNAYQQIKQDTLNALFTNLANKPHAIKVCQKAFDTSIYQPIALIITNIINQMVVVEYSLLSQTSAFNPINTALSLSMIMKKYAKDIQPTLNDSLGALKNCNPNLDTFKQQSVEIIRNNSGISLNPKVL
ncbi:hypothetical protein [Helicobacter cetorum]|uniref:hypothetical protein n=1 Tax=Helicobacter cetorum TaxID=138563 RepID=UPI000CF1A623|nr:hypothetical protein [Helicobacter cetorum]